MTRRILFGIGRAVRAINVGFYVALVGLVIAAYFGTAAYHDYLAGDLQMPPWGHSGLRDCADRVIAVVTGHYEDTESARVCFASARFTDMTSEDFADFARRAGASKPQDYVRVGQVTPESGQGTIVVYVARDGDPDTHYAVYLDAAGKVLGLS